MIFSALMFLDTLAHAQDSFWERTSGPYTGGYVVSIAINSYGHVFAGSLNDGVYRSTDGCKTWTRLGLNENYRTVQTFAIDTSGNIFAGTTNGLFWSTNNGQNWISLGLDRQEVSSLLIRSNGEIYAGTNLCSYCSASGLVRSTDSGGTWASIGFDSSDVRAIAVNSSRHIFAAVWGRSNGVYRSTDGGSSWIKVFNYATRCLAVNSEGHIFAGSENAIGLNRSTNNGETWVRLATGTFHSIAFDSTGNILAATSNGLSRSKDNGQSWEYFGISGRIVAINSGGHIFGGYDGLYRSTDNGKSWRVVGISGSASINTLQISPRGYIFATTNANQVFRSSNDGVSWEHISNLDWLTELTADSAGQLFAFTGYGIFRSTDDGQTWSYFGLKDKHSYSIIRSANGSVLVGTSNGILRTTDNGSSWTESGLMDAGILSLAISLDGVILAGTQIRGVYRSTDDGYSWIYAGMGNSTVEHVLIGSNGSFFAVAQREIFRSTNNGDNWARVADGFSSDLIVDLAINSLGHILVSMVYGEVIRSIDDGDHWTQLSKRSANFFFVRDYALSFTDFLFLGANSGVYRSIHQTTGIERASVGTPSLFSLEQNYPNPFNPRTRIRFGIPAKGFVSLKVYNLLGQEVQTLLDEQLYPCSYEVSWDATGFPSGIYFYRLQSGDFVESKKLILLK